MEKVTQFNIKLKNVPGELANFSKQVADAWVNILAMSVRSSGDEGMVYLVSEDPEKTRNTLNEKDIPFSEEPVLMVEIENRVGALAEVTSRFGEESLNIEHVYTSVSAGGQNTIAIIKAEDVYRALDVFGDEL